MGFTLNTLKFEGSWSHTHCTPLSSLLPPISSPPSVRIREHITSRLTSHTEEVCGLKWSPSGRQLASGGNDNLLYVWDAAALSSASARSTAPSPSFSSSSSSLRHHHLQQPWLHRFDAHTAAVKALAWCPFQANLLASGGGTMDRSIKFWNTHTGTCINSVDTGSQVRCCAVQHGVVRCCETWCGAVL